MIIYILIINLLLTIIFQRSYAAEDVATYCFEPDVTLESVKQSIGFILLETDNVSQRMEDHCLDVVIGEKRKVILDKYLSKRYKLVSETTKDLPACHIELKTITQKKLNTNDFKLGTKSNLIVNESSTNAVTTSEMLLGAGFAGKLATGEQSLQVECRPVGVDAFNLIFYFEEKNKAQVSTSVKLNKFEVMNLASIKKILDEKNKTLGIPQTAIINSQGTEEIHYELKVY
jgi:hypothetical protein